MIQQEAGRNIIFFTFIFNFYMYIADVALENNSTWFAIFFPMFKFYGSLEDLHCFKYILKRST
jgi:hypothetical protein